MTGKSIILNVWIESVAGREEELATHLFALVSPTRGEQGCVTYKLHRDPNNPLKFMFYEEFADQVSLDRHVSAPYFKEFLSYRASGVDPVAHQTVTTWEGLEASGSCA